jgi:hypothetical protein
MASRSRGGRAAAAATIDRRRIARGLIAHEHRSAAGLLALLVLAYLWPVLLGGKALAPTGLLYGSTPWATAAPEGIQALTNPQLADAVFLYYPWNVLARQLLHAGVFPAWNPYALAGTPLFANFQVAWASPFSLPLWILPLNHGLGVAAALKLWMGGFGTYLLVRELRLGFWPAMLSGVSFTLCAFGVVWLAHGVFVSAAAMLPWGVWLVERLLRRGRASDGLALVAVVAVVQTAGHPGTQLHVTSAIVVYALARGAAVADVDRRERLRRLGLVAAGLALGSLLSAVVLLPAQVTSHETIGVVARESHPQVFPGWHMPVGVLRTALFPDWWGRPESYEVLGAPANFRERTFYAGAAPLVLALLALVTPGAWRRKAPFALLALGGAAVAVHTPLQSAVMHLPLFHGVQNQRILLWFVFAVPVLAAFGLHAALERPRRGRTWAVVGVALLAPVVAALSAGGANVNDAVHAFLHRGDAADGGTLALASIGWWTVWVLVLAAILALVRRRPRVVALLVVVVALDLLHFAHGYQKMTPASAVVPPVTPAIGFLRQHVGEARIAGLANTLPVDFTTVYGLREVRGVDVPQPSLRFDWLWGAMNPTDDYSEIAKPTPRTFRVLGLLGVRYLLAPPQASISVPGVALAYRGADATVFTDAYALPRAFVVGRIRALDGPRRETTAVIAPSFDARREAVVRGDRPTGALPPPGAGGSARVVRERNAEVTLRATLSRAGLVVLDDAIAPGWTVEVDGRPARALTADVVLPAGTHTIRWTYRVPGLRAGAALSALGLLAALGWAGWLVSRRRAGRSRRA